MANEEIKVIGFYVDRDGDKTEAKDVFVAVDDFPDTHRITLYCPIGQHHEGDRAYLDECTKITKEEYMKTSKLFYTPQDYLN